MVSIRGLNSRGRDESPSTPLKDLVGVNTFLLTVSNTGTSLGLERDLVRVAGGKPQIMDEVVETRRRNNCCWLGIWLRPRTSPVRCSVHVSNALLRSAPSTPRGCDSLAFGFVALFRAPEMQITCTSNHDCWDLGLQHVLQFLEKQGILESYSMLLWSEQAMVSTTRDGPLQVNAHDRVPDRRRWAW